MSNYLNLVELPDGTLKVGDDSDTNGNGLKDINNIPAHVEIPIGVTIIGRKAFYQCIIGSVSFPSSLIEIRDSAFDQSQIQNETFEFPSSLLKLGHYSFPANNFKIVKLNSKIREIDFDPFGQCPKLEKIIVPQENIFFSNDAQGALYSKSQKRLIQVPCTRKKLLICVILMKLFYLLHYELLEKTFFLHAMLFKKFIFTALASIQIIVYFIIFIVLHTFIIIQSRQFHQLKSSTLQKISQKIIQK